MYKGVSTAHLWSRGRGDPYPDTELDFLPFDLHLVDLKCADNEPPVRWKLGERGLSTDTEIDANRGARLVLR